MIYDFYAFFQIERKTPEKSKVEIDNLTIGEEHYSKIINPLSKIMLLSTAYAIKKKLPNKNGIPEKIDSNVYVKIGEGNNAKGLKAIIHSRSDYDDYINDISSKLNNLGINSIIDISSLCKGSWLLEFPITLTEPFISMDDIPFYIIDNPCRKDKVFGIPVTSAMTWKGNLRWTLMNLYLESTVDNPEMFSQIRFRHTLLFGIEKGWNEEKGWNNYLNKLCPVAREQYIKLLKDKFNINNVNELNIKGMLYFYPTFWNRINMFVINPHSRLTKSGEKPIYFEAVPAGAKGIFRLIYIPIYYLGLSDEDFKEKILKDLNDIIIGIKEMMLTYGFSAKKSLGYGKIKDNWVKDESVLSIKGFYDSKKFGSFNELENIVNKMRGIEDE
ncbi:MAG: RAMP superfamily CRISPR-associated protein [Promethearchaeota archaeon]